MRRRRCLRPWPKLLNEAAEAGGRLGPRHPALRAHAQARQTAGTIAAVKLPNAAAQAIAGPSRLATITSPSAVTSVSPDWPTLGHSVPIFWPALRVLSRFGHRTAAAIALLRARRLRHALAGG